MGDLNKNVPRLRFPGYTDAWVKCEFATFIERINISSDSDLIPKVEFEDIKSGMGYLNKDISRKFDDRKGTLFQPKDILFGKLRPYLKNWLFPDFTGVALGDFWVFRALNSNPEFAYVLIQSPKFQAIANDTAGTKMPRSDWKIVSNSEFWMPSIKEQTKIGEFFKHLDNLITVNERELNKLKDLKKSYLEKMFPKNGSDIPELRFPGYADAWVKCTLGDLMDVTSVKRIHQSDWRNSGVPFYRARDIVAFAKNEIISDPLFIDLARYEEYSIQSGKVESGNLLVTGVGTIGIPYLVKGTSPLYFKDGNIIWFKNKKLDGKYLYYSFTANSIQQFIHYSAGTGTVSTYTIDTGKKTPIFEPVIDEQYKIGTFFDKLDDLITVNERELNKLKELKKSYLKDMFV